MSAVNLLLVAAGFVVVTVVGGLVATLSWWFETTIYEPLTNYDMARHNKVSNSITDFWASVASLVCLIPQLLFSALYGIATNLVTNAWRLLFLMLFVMVGMAMLQYHHELYRAELIVSQCIIMPFCNHFLFPLFNIARIAFNTGIILWDFGVDMYAFYEWGPVIIFIKCTIHTTSATDLFAYLVNIMMVLAQDLTAWFAAGFMTTDLDLMNTLDAIGLFADTLISPFTCLCKALNFVYRGLATWWRMLELHQALNCALNFFVKVAQIPINTMMATPHRPNFEEATLRACCALKSTAEVIQNTVLLIAELLWGVFTNVALPDTIRRVLSVKWARIVAEPLCGAARFVNMSLTAVVHYDALADATGSGVAYFQFGHLIDEFKAAAGFLASVFTLLNNDAQAFVDQALVSMLNIVAFLLEWIPGNIFYWLFGGPLPFYPTAPYGSFVNFLKYYFPDYWLKPGFVDSPSTYVYETALNDSFNSLFQLTQALGNLIANLLGMDPLGGIVQHTLNIIVCLFMVLANLTSFIFTIETFDTDIRTTARRVNFDPLFDEAYFLAGSLGDFSRQFATPDPLTNLTCQISANESQNSVFCCFGNLVERLVDVVTIATQQMVHFLQDLVTLPTGNVIYCIAFIGFNHSLIDRCLRIPDLSTALFLLDAALCDLTCTVFSVIPMLTAFQCQFPLPVPSGDPHVPPQPPKPCGHVSTCVSILVCRILRLLLAPLVIINGFMAKTLRGVSYADFTILGSFILKVLCDIIADALAAFGLLVNCTLCAFVGSGTNCDDSIYQLFVSIGDLVRFLPMIMTRLFMVVVKLVLTFLVGLFTGDPVGAFIRFVVGILTDLFGGLGSAVVDFLAKFLNAIGLGFLGDFIRILWRGFCPVLQLILNAIIVILKIITFGTVQINFVNFCCDGSPDCQPSQRRRFDYNAEGSVVDGVLNVNLDNWIAATVKIVQWDASNPCNRTMARYAGYAWQNLTDWEQNDVLYCLIKPYWLVRTDNQTAMPAPFANSTCDRLIIEYNNTEWTSIEVGSRSTIIDCMHARIFVDSVRTSVGIPWLPSDLLTNPFRKWVFGAEFARGLLVYWQYFSDKTVTADTFLSAVYQQNWATMGLYTAFYGDVHTADDILRFRDHYRLVDYFNWNNATQYEAVDAVSIGFWNFINLAMGKLMEVVTAKSDDTLDPAQYLTYSYTLDSAAAGVTSSFYGLISEVVFALRNMSAFWSNPANVKKRAAAYQILQEGGAGMWRSAVNQLTMMGIDYRMAKLNESRYWGGNCSADEAQQFMDEYDRWVHHDERSWAYHLQRWWSRNKDTLFTPHPISNPRDGQRRQSYNQSTHLFSYTDERTGAVIGESGRARVSRLLGALNRGSARSNARWQALAHLVDIAKERLYINVIRNNMEYAVGYMNRVYATADSDDNRPVSAASYRVDTELLEKYYRQQTAAEKVWIRPEAAGMAREPTAVERQRQRTQALYCVRDEYKQDGLCKDYVPAAPGPPAAAAERHGDIGKMTPEERANYYDEVRRLATTGRRYVIDQESTIVNAGHAKGTILRSHSAANALRRARFVTQSLVLIDSFIDLTCYTNITFGNSTLCDECFIVDQALGRVETGLGWVDLYYTQGQYRAALNVSMAYWDYAADDDARCWVGDSPELGVHDFPGFVANGTWLDTLGYNLRYLGDNTPNKTRFDDVWALIQAAANATSNATTNSTTDLAHDYQYANAWVFYFVLLVFGALWNVLVDFVIWVAGASESGDISSEFGEFFIDWFVLCDWLTGYDYRGIHKRFSFGETVLMFGSVWVGLSVFFYLTIQFSLFSVLAYMGLSVLVTFSFFRSISNNFSFLCLPGLDAELANDSMYFLVYTLMSKCSWFFAFLIKNEEYDNDTCAACDNAGGWDILNCVTERGFGDIFANLAFMLQYHWPEALQWVRESRWVPVVLLYQIPYVNQRVNAFAHVDMSDRANYRQYMGCNYIVTLFWNAYFLAVLAYLLQMAWPAVAAVFAIALVLGNIAFRFFALIDAICLDTYVSRSTAPFTQMGLVDTPIGEHVDEVDDLGDMLPDDGSAAQQQQQQYNFGANYYQYGAAARHLRTHYRFDPESVFNLNTLRNLAQRMWDNAGWMDDRKQR
jgi:hypothetical protein